MAPAFHGDGWCCSATRPREMLADQQRVLRHARHPVILADGGRPGRPDRRAGRFSGQRVDDPGRWGLGIVPAGCARGAEWRRSSRSAAQRAGRARPGRRPPGAAPISMRWSASCHRWRPWAPEERAGPVEMGVGYSRHRPVRPSSSMVRRRCCLPGPEGRVVAGIATPEGGHRSMSTDVGRRFLSARSRP